MISALSFLPLKKIALNEHCDLPNTAQCYLQPRSSSLNHQQRPAQAGGRKRAAAAHYKKLPPKASAYLRARGAADFVDPPYGAATGPASRRANKLALFARNFRGEQEGRDRPRADGRPIIATMTPQMLFLVILGAVDALAPADNRAGLLHLLTQRSVQTNVYYLTNFHDEPKAKWLARYREPVVSLEMDRISDRSVQPRYHGLDAYCQEDDEAPIDYLRDMMTAELVEY